MLVLASAGMILVYLGLAIAGWGGFDAFFANPARIALVIATVVMAGAATVQFSESEHRRARGSLQPLGHRRAGPDRPSVGLAAGLHRPQGVLDHRRRYRPLDRRRPLCRRWRAAALARLRARPPLQRAGRHPARAYAGDGWHLSHHPQSELPRPVRAVAGLGACVPVAGRRAAGGAHDPAVDRAHPLGRSAAARAVRRSSTSPIAPVRGGCFPGSTSRAQRRTISAPHAASFSAMPS